MRAEGSLEISASTEEAWDALTDPGVIVGCVPGGSGVTVEPVGPTELRLRGKIGQGFLRMSAEGRVELTDLDRPASSEARLHASLAGTSLEATVALALTSLEPRLTRIAWTADATIAGPLAGMATPYVERDAPGVIARVLECVKSRLEPGSEPEAA